MQRQAGRVFCFLAIALASQQALAQATLLPPITLPTAVAPSMPAGTTAPAAAAPAAPSQNAPVTFTADEVQYDQNAALVVARGGGGLPGRAHSARR